MAERGHSLCRAGLRDVPGLGMLPPCPLSLLCKGTLVLAGRGAVCVGLGLKGELKPQGQLCAAGRVRGGMGRLAQPADRLLVPPL